MKNSGFNFIGVNLYSLCTKKIWKEYLYLSDFISKSNARWNAKETNNDFVVENFINSASYFTLAEVKDVKWDPQSELWHGI